MNTLDVSTDYDDVRIHEDELALIDDADLLRLRMSRDVLYRCFAEGVVLMQGENPVAMQPVAYETKGGKWEVVLIHFKTRSKMQA